MNNRQKAINQISKDDMRYSIFGFRKTRILSRKNVRDLDFEELIIYKNLR
ncbi:hypothetical protein [Clostridium akagii]|nr:hypothetical protein [Clostridium akagii]